jgi:tetratricopeptide (TPR) repeat protein
MRFPGFTLGQSPATPLIEQGDQLRQAGHSEQALSCYLRAIEADPQAPGAHNSAGMCYYEAGDSARACGCFTRALQLDTRQANIWGNRALAHNALGDFEAAIPDATKAVELAPTDHDWWSMRGELLRKVGRLDEALRDLTQAVTMAPHKPEYCFFRGRVLRLLGQTEAAIASHRQAMRGGAQALGDLAGDAINDAGICYLDAGQPAESLRLFELAIPHQPDNAAFRANRGIACERLSRWREALDAYTEAIEICPQHADYYTYRGDCHFELKNYRPAADDFRSAVRLDRTRVKDRVALGAALHKLDQPDAALAELQAALRQEPKNASALRWIGSVHFERKDYDAALAWYGKSLQAQPDSWATYYDRAACLAKVGRHPDAVADWKQCLRVDPRSSDAMFSLIEACAEHKDEATPWKILSERVESAPDDPLTYHWLAYFHKTNHRRQEAIEHYTLAIDLDPQSPVYFAARGELRYRLDEFQAAIDDYTAALLLDANQCGYFNGRGLALEELGKDQAALEDYSRAIALAPDNCGGHHNRSELYFKLGKLPEALADMTRAIEAHPDGLSHFAARGQIHLAMGNSALAKADFDEASKELLEELRAMQATSKLVRAVLVQANSHLFAPGLTQYPGYVLFSLERELNQSPDFLLQLAESMFDLKGIECETADDRFVSALITDEIHRGDERARLPSSFTEGHSVYGSGLMFPRQFLKDGHLTTRVFPCLAELGEQGRIRLAPHWAVKSKQEVT